MDQISAEADRILQGESKAIEGWLNGLWDRAKKAGELIASLREEKADLQSKVVALNEELIRVKSELTRSEEMVRSLSSDHPSDQQPLLSNGERELLSTRVKDLMAKLDAYI